MDLEKMKARLKEIVARVSELEAVDELTDEHVTELENLQAESNSLASRIKAKETIDSIKKQDSAPNRKAPEAKTQPTVEAKKNRLVDDPKLGFDNAGSFYKDVASARNGAVSETLRAANGANEKIAEDGGFLVPPDFTTEIQKKIENGDESLVPYTRQFKTTSNNFSMPVYETAPWGTEGIQAYWESEASTYQKTRPQVSNVDLKLHKLTALVYATDEVLEDAVGLAQLINDTAPEAIVAKINNAIIAGTGAGQPLGILNSTFKVKVSKVSMQAADTIRFENVNEMLGRLLPQYINGAFWLTHPQAWPQLRGMKFLESASSPVPVYMPPTGVAGSPYGSLYALPVKTFMGAVKALGDEGDFMLLNLRGYSSVVKTAGIQQSISTHVQFVTDEVAFKFRTRIAGQSHFKAPVTTQNGSYQMSSLITLEDR